MSRRRGKDGSEEALLGIDGSPRASFEDEKDSPNKFDQVSNKTEVPLTPTQHSTICGSLTTIRQRSQAKRRCGSADHPGHVSSYLSSYSLVYLELSQDLVTTSIRPSPSMANRHHGIPPRKGAPTRRGKKAIGKPRTWYVR